MYVGGCAHCRHVLYEQRLDRLSWKIEFSAIELLDAGQVRQMISPGRPRVSCSARTHVHERKREERTKKSQGESLAIIIDVSIVSGRKSSYSN